MSENSWITEGLVQFSESPLWKTPVENFIDDNCCIFSTDAEMKLEYTVVHHKFRELVDTLLTSCVEELGVPMETAVEALRTALQDRSDDANARTQRSAAKKMLTQVFSVDNFSMFYTLMVKRNLELDILACASLAAHGVNLDDGVLHSTEEVYGKKDKMPARKQRAFEANGQVADDDALRLAIEASLQDPQSQEQIRAYSEVCAQENMNLQVEDAEREAQHQRIELEESLRDQTSTPEVEKYRKERLELIDNNKNSQILSIQSHTMSGPKQSFYHDKRRPIAEFSCPEIPEMPLPAQSPQPTTAQAPLPPPSSTVLPPIGHQQGALPSISRKSAAAVPSGAAGTATPSPTATTTTGVALPAPAQPDKKELERRVQYMREQREIILARNRATRQEQLDSCVQQGNPVSGGSGSAAAATGTQKDLTVEIARRLRGDLVGEGRKRAN
ncbi:hypothetical protein ABL78_6872 [Leptomonas seymouri]|uniref:Cilia- and flagella-associated protein 36 n=1 Tax=Leptomonas seymouri TaxID=5684 RepID=A0A0N0P3F6_LEPSE|nr:hypothetical protein ABL78_6872 [Leptomonas seymouri]|eukprot:KPI84069.1 hypothetical protein ABL78_6872 [Leptomonas seymouri]